MAVSYRLVARVGRRLLARRRVRADLLVRAVATRVERRRGLEATRADARGGGLHGDHRLDEVVRRRRVPADEMRIDEAQLDALRKRTRHLAPGQRIDLELQALAGASLGVLRPAEV